MGQRIKITGYINIEELAPEHVDLEDATGFSEEGHLTYVVGEYGTTPQIHSLEDAEAELVNE